MARYGKIDVRLWGDSKFRELSPLPPCGQGLWIYLLAPRERLRIPGLIAAGEGALADSLRWPVEAFRKAFREVSSKGMATADWKAPLVWVPNAIRYNPPENPNVVKGWRVEWDEIPECELKAEAWRALKAFLEGYKKAFLEAFLNTCPQPSRNQEQEQEQEQDQARSLRSLAGRGRAKAKLGPLGAAAVAAVARGLGHALKPAASQADADELEERIRSYGGVDAAVEYFAATCRERDTEPEGVGLLLLWLRDLGPVKAGVARGGA